jgi:hypothetical protein
MLEERQQRLAFCRCQPVHAWHPAIARQLHGLTLFFEIPVSYLSVSRKRLGLARRLLMS